MKHIVNYIFILFALVGCAQKSDTSADSAEYVKTDIRHATGFEIYNASDHKKVVVYNPWAKDKTIQQQYYLVSDASVDVPADGKKIVVPITKLASASCTHYEFIDLLGKIETITGICDPHRTYNSTLQQRYADGLINNLGDAYNTDIERLLNLHPDGFMVSSYNQDDKNSERIEQTGIKIIYNNEWMEQTLLARCEWIKFVAAFYNEEAKADSIFNAIESEYNAAKALVQHIDNKPSIVCGGNFKGTWYMPGGNSYMTNLIIDAGADYKYADDTNEGSLPLNFESVLLDFHDTDIWLNAPAESMAELAQMDKRHELFRPFKEGRVYGFYARKTQETNDFWESAVARPHILLKDVIWALYPDMQAEYTPTYIMQLK